MNSIAESAGQRVDRLAKDLVSRKGLSYGDAVRGVLKADPNLAVEYSSGQVASAKAYAELSSSEQIMALLQVDRDRTQKLAGDLLNSAAMQLCGSHVKGTGQTTPEGSGCTAVVECAIPLVG